jgi:hypothetical protein
MRTTFGLATTLAGVLTCLPLDGAAPRFYPDDPVAKNHDTQDASGTTFFEVDDAFESMESLFTNAGDPVRDVRAVAINTVDQVPDSSWFTNRAGVVPLTPADVARGPNVTNGPAAGVWTVVSAKSDGIMPGFVIRDRAGLDWFIKFDPVGYAGMASGAEVTSTRLLWALGMNVPENHIAYLRPGQLVLAPSATIRTHNRKRAMATRDIAQLLERAARGADGTYRVLASRRIDGKPLGPFRFHGVRPDDPNDYIRHEHRRELRGLATWAAWLNHVDAKSSNTFDALVTENGRAFVKHYLIDFGSTLGSAGVRPREPFEGSEYLYDGRSTLRSALGLGFDVRPWRHVRRFESAEAGALPDSTDWDPDAWKPRYPNPAFLRARADDRFWAARRVRALTPDLVAAAVDAADYKDEASRAAVLTFLLQRRAAIVRRYLTGINPVVDPRLDAGGLLRFDNAAVDADVARIPPGYHTRWSWFDNATGATTPFGDVWSVTGEVAAPQPLTPAPDRFVKVEIRATGALDPSWDAPVHAYFRGTDRAWSLVGFEQMPAGNPPSPARLAGDPGTATVARRAASGMSPAAAR